MIEAAVGIVINAEGNILIQRRSTSCPNYPGWWELPGGKLEIGETDTNALCRELYEEVGIRVLAVAPVLLGATYNFGTLDRPNWIKVSFYAVTRYACEPDSKKNQAFKWCTLNSLVVGFRLPPLNHSALYLLKTEIADKMGININRGL